MPRFLQENELLMHAPLTEMFKVPLILEGSSFEFTKSIVSVLPLIFIGWLSVRFLLIGDINNFVNVFAEVSLERINVLSWSVKQLKMNKTGPKILSWETFVKKWLSL